MISHLHFTCMHLHFGLLIVLTLKKMLVLLSLFAGLADLVNYFQGVPHQNVTSLRSVSTTPTPQHGVYNSINVIHHTDTHLLLPAVFERRKISIGTKNEKINTLDSSLKKIESETAAKSKMTTPENILNRFIESESHTTEHSIQKNDYNNNLESIGENSENKAISPSGFISREPNQDRDDYNMQMQMLQQTSDSFGSSSTDKSMYIESTTFDEFGENDLNSLISNSNLADEELDNDESTAANDITIKPSIGIQEGKFYRIQNDMDDSYLTVIVDTKMGRNNLAKVSTAEFLNSNSQLWRIKKHKKGFFVMPRDSIPNEISTKRNNKPRQWQIISSDAHPGAVKLISIDGKECVGPDGGLQISYCSHAVNWNFISERKFYQKRESDV